VAAAGARPPSAVRCVRAGTGARRRRAWQGLSGADCALWGSLTLPAWARLGPMRGRLQGSPSCARNQLRGVADVHGNHSRRY